MVAIGRYFHGQRRYEEALAAYREALAQDASLADAHNGMGVIHAAQGRFDDAIAEFRAAIALAPLAAHLRNNLGYALLLKSDAAAVAALEEALRLDPGNERAQHNLRLAKPSNTAPEAERASEPAAPAQPAPPLAIVTSNATLAAVAPGVYELRSAAPPASEPATGPRAAPERRPYNLEVSNGNGAPGMARRVAGFLSRHDFAARRLTNAASFRAPATVVEYRTGYRAEAMAMAAVLPTAVALVESQALRSDVDVRLVLGRDVRNNVALIAPAPAESVPPSQAHLARSTR
jgi:tetratricopeptide (TPR) repeat protein